MEGFSDSRIERDMEQLAKSTAMTAKEFSKALITLLKGLQEQKLAKELIAHTNKGGQLGFLEAGPAYSKDLLRELKQNNVACWQFDNANKNKRFVMIKDTDIEKAKEIRNVVLLRKAIISVASKEDMFSANYNKKIGSVNGLGLAEVEHMKVAASSMGFTISNEMNKEGKHTLYYQEKDELKFHQAFNKMAWSFSGKDGGIRIAQMEYDAKTHQSAVDKAKEGKEDFYAIDVDDQSKVLHVDRHGMRYMNGNEIIEDHNRHDINFSTHLELSLSELDNFVILTEDELYLPKEQRDKIIESKNKRPVLTQREIDETEKQREIRRNIEARFSLENGEMPKYSMDFYNGEISFESFYGIELLNDAHDKEIAENIEEQINSYNERLKNVNFEKVKVTERDLQNIIDSKRVDPDKAQDTKSREEKNR